MKIKLKIIFSLVIFCVAFFIGHSIVNAVFGFSDKLFQSDVIVVYGNQVYADKTVSKRLQTRLDKTIELYKKGFAPKIIVTGGIDKNQNDEALVMKNYLVEVGSVPESAIIMDNQGVNTHASVLFVKNYLEKNQQGSVINVSQYSHLMRINLAMKKCGINKAGHSHADYFFEPRNFYTMVREFFAFYSYLIKY